MTSLKDIGEFGLIERIKRGAVSKRKDVLVGIGDDCAVLDDVLDAVRDDVRGKEPGTVSLVSTDLLVEGVHFDLRYFSPIMLGMKSAAVNLSDIAAMGGTPKYILTSIAIPKSTTLEFVSGFYKGIKKMVGKFNVSLIGGDTSSSKGGLFISITVIGEAKRGEYLTRKGSKAGDAIFVTGNIGDSSAGLDILLHEREVDERIKNYLIKKHLTVNPRIDEGIFLAKSKCVNSMIDLSDGIGSDLRRICEMSNVGAEVDLKSLPISSQLKKYSACVGKEPSHFALYGGEDYELMFTVKEGHEDKLEKSFKNRFGNRIFKVGRITKGREILSVDVTGQKSALKEAYNHFQTVSTS